MKAISNNLRRTVDAFYKRYEDLEDNIASKRPGRGEWSLKEIIGHLINSASNNQQRFVGLQTVEV